MKARWCIYVSGSWAIIGSCKGSGTKPLTGPMRTYWQLDLLEQTSVKFQVFEKMRLKMSSAKWRPLCPGFIVLSKKAATCIPVVPGYSITEPSETGSHGVELDLFDGDGGGVQLNSRLNNVLCGLLTGQHIVGPVQTQWQRLMEKIKSDIFHLSSWIEFWNIFKHKDTIVSVLKR